MDPNVMNVLRKRKSYPAIFKREIIIYSDQHGTRAAARKYGINESTIRGWRLHRLAIFKSETQRRALRRGKVSHEKLEDEVATFINERRKSALPVTYDNIQQKAREIAKIQRIPRTAFKASLGWVQRFLKRRGYALGRRTSICQKLPSDFERKLIEFQRYIISLRVRTNFLLSQIGNADETPIWFDMPANRTIAEKGSKEVRLKSTGNEKRRVTVMLAITGDGRKLPPFLIFKRLLMPKPTKGERFPPGVVVRVQKDGWMTQELMLDWLKNIWDKRPGAALNLPALLVLDAFRGHLTEDVKSALRRSKTEMAIIPGGMTSVLQPLDVAVNKPFKDYVRQQYYNWLEKEDLPTTPSGKIRRASPFIVAQWIKAAWDRIPEDTVSRSFKKCCITNALDVSEDDIVWNADDPVTDDPADSDYSDESESPTSSEEEDVD